MLEFFREKRIFIIIGVIAILLIGWYFYNSKDDSEVVNQNEIAVLENETKEDEEEIIVVHITGEVKKPGVVRVKEGSRIEDIIKAAGGLTENADITNINLAYIAEDGIKIRIPATGDDELSKQNYITEGIGEGMIASNENNLGSSSSLVNINTASQTELETLPGIGPSIASKIIEYRNENGKFKNIDDVKNVTGIGNNKFEKIKEFIKVK